MTVGGLKQPQENKINFDILFFLRFKMASENCIDQTSSLFLEDFEDGYQGSRSTGM